jgi:hypothetical protein
MLTGRGRYEEMSYELRSLLVRLGRFWSGRERQRHAERTQGHLRFTTRSRISEPFSAWISYLPNPPSP